MSSDQFVFSNQEDSSIVVWKALGDQWYAAIVSKATPDRVGELVTIQGMDFAISTAKQFDYHSGLYIEHAVPWTRIGRSVREMRIGKFWIEIGKFDKNPLADWAYKALQNAKDGAIRLSVGFLTPAVQRKRGIYTKLLKFDTSLVLKPAHPETHIIVGGTKMSDLMQRVLKLLGPENEQEEEKALAMLKELFATKSMDGELAFVGKADKDKKEDGGGFPAFLKKVKAEDKEMMAMLEKMAEAMPEDETIKKACATMKKRMGAYPAIEEEEKQEPPEMEEEEEEEEAMATKTKSGEGVQTLLTAVAEIVDARLAPLTEAIAGLSKTSGRVVELTERVKNLEANEQAAEVIAALVKRLPELSFTRSTRPSEDADEVGDTAGLIEELQKRLDFGEDAPSHPLAHFIGGGTN